MNEPLKVTVGNETVPSEKLSNWWRYRELKNPFSGWVFILHTRTDSYCTTVIASNASDLISVILALKWKVRKNKLFHLSFLMEFSAVAAVYRRRLWYGDSHTNLLDHAQNLSWKQFALKSQANSIRDTSIQVEVNSIHPVASVKNLGIHLDMHLTMQKHACGLCC